jgi:hypothetical protein
VVAALALLAIPALILSTHAALHDETALIRQCAQDPKNLLQVWINSTGQRLNCIVRLPDGRVGDQVIQNCKRGVMEITDYILGGGSLDEAIIILTAKNCVRVWPGK